jgi:hypothetical protein
MSDTILLWVLLVFLGVTHAVMIALGLAWTFG